MLDTAGNARPVQGAPSENTGLSVTEKATRAADRRAGDFTNELLRRALVSIL
jgi:hypothetical protein